MREGEEATDRVTLGRKITVLRGAIHALERDGWVQGTYHGAHGHCAVGALEVGANVFIPLTMYSTQLQRAIQHSVAADVAAAIVHRWVAKPMPIIIDFNDSAATSSEDVLVLFKEVLADYEEEYAE